MMCWERLEFLIGKGPRPEIIRIKTSKKRPDATCIKDR